MTEFFKHWRRRIGVVTLMLASLFMAGWVRSEVVFDYFTFRLGKGTQVQFSCSCSSIICVSWYEGPELNSNSPKWLTFRRNLLDDPVLTQWQPPFSYTAEPMNLRTIHRWTISYWAITTPLTFISLWLLLSKPRKSTRMEIIEPTGNEGA